MKNNSIQAVAARFLLCSATLAFLLIVSFSILAHFTLFTVDVPVLVVVWIVGSVLATALGYLFILLGKMVGRLSQAQKVKNEKH